MEGTDITGFLVQVVNFSELGDTVVELTLAL